MCNLYSITTNQAGSASSADTSATWRSTAPKKPVPERQQQQTEPDKGKRKTHRLKPRGIKPAPAL
jgi:hypothetical protein